MCHRRHKSFTCSYFSSRVPSKALLRPYTTWPFSYTAYYNYSKQSSWIINPSVCLCFTIKSTINASSIWRRLPLVEMGIRIDQFNEKFWHKIYQKAKRKIKYLPETCNFKVMNRSHLWCPVQGTLLNSWNNIPHKIFLTTFARRKRSTGWLVWVFEL